MLWKTIIALCTKIISTLLVFLQINCMLRDMSKVHCVGRVQSF
jgi:hypothetical protein